MAIGAGIMRTRTVSTGADIADGARLLREGNSASLVALRVKPTEPPAFKRNFDASLCRDRFRSALQES
jgi:phosphonopyruvate decarboxylase